MSSMQWDREWWGQAGQLVQQRLIELHRSGATRGEVASRAGVSQRTLYTLSRGSPVRPLTAEKIFDALAIHPPQAMRSEGLAVADKRYGAYVADNYRNHEGLFYAYRWSFKYEGKIFRSLYKIEWSEEKRCLIFTNNETYFSKRRNKKIEELHTGEIYICPDTHIISMISVENGSFRAVKLGRLCKEDLIASGAIICDMREIGSGTPRPALSPIYLKKITGDYRYIDGVADIRIIEPGEDLYNEAKAYLLSAERDVVKFGLVGRTPN